MNHNESKVCYCKEFEDYRAENSLGRSKNRQKEMEMYNWGVEDKIKAWREKHKELVNDPSKKDFVEKVEKEMRGG